MQLPNNELTHVPKRSLLFPTFFDKAAAPDNAWQKHWHQTMSAEKSRLVPSTYNNSGIDGSTVSKDSPSWREFRYCAKLVVPSLRDRSVVLANFHMNACLSNGRNRKKLAK